MKTAWLYLVYLLFPLPFTALILLSIPLPNFAKMPVKSSISWVIDKVVFAEIAEHLTIHTIAVFISLGLFVLEAFETSKSKLLDKGTLWRNQRNFWISLFGLSLWMILRLVHNMNKEIIQLTRDCDEEKKKKNE